MTSFTQYEIYLPISKFNTRNLKSKVQIIRKQLIEYFGGLTDTRFKNKGYWKMQDITIKDEIIVWKIISTKGKKGEAVLKKYQKKLQQLLNETQILITKTKFEKL